MILLPSCSCCGSGPPPRLPDYVVNLCGSQCALGVTVGGINSWDFSCDEAAVPEPWSVSAWYPASYGQSAAFYVSESLDGQDYEPLGIVSFESFPSSGSRTMRGGNGGYGVGSGQSEGEISMAIAGWTADPSASADYSYASLTYTAKFSMSCYDLGGDWDGECDHECAEFFGPCVQKLCAYLQMTYSRTDYEWTGAGHVVASWVTCTKVRSRGNPMVISYAGSSTATSVIVRKQTCEEFDADSENPAQNQCWPSYESPPEACGFSYPSFFPPDTVEVSLSLDEIAINGVTHSWEYLDDSASDQDNPSGGSLQTCDFPAEATSEKQFTVTVHESCCFTDCDYETNLCCNPLP